jgi:hypothetical protein
MAEATGETESTTGPIYLPMQEYLKNRGYREEDVNSRWTCGDYEQVRKAGH